MTRVPATRPDEWAALDRRWRVWASAGIAAVVVICVVFGFVILPKRMVPGDTAAAIRRAVGTPRVEPPAVGPTPTARDTERASDVTWGPQTRNLLSQASTQLGSATAERVCRACHGTDGVGLVPTYPNLTHQSAAAIFKQLRDYRSGARQGGLAAVMAPIAAALDDRQMADVAAYYASLARNVRENSANVPSQIIQLVKNGSPARALPPCDACHGVNMSGPEESPVLVGQSIPYFEQQLNAFAAGDRRNDIYGRMRMIARALTPEERRQLAIYYGPRK